MIQDINPGGLQGAPKTKLGALSLPLTWYYSVSPEATTGGGPRTACSGSKRSRREMEAGFQRKAFLLGQVPATFAVAVANPPLWKSKTHSTL